MRPILILMLMMVPLFAQASVAEKAGQDSDSPALTYRLKTISVVRTSPNGHIVDVWDSNTLFTSNVADGDWIRVTGTFPDGDWQPVSKPLWVNRYYTKSFTPKYKPTPARTHPGVVRYVEIDKSTFELKVIEKRDKQKDVIFKTEVALGMDRCLPKSKGGRCYFTDPGEYKVRWKIHDPKGIEWCIPKSMEKEYSNAIARGERCYRGAIGRHALNIGKTYAIHGTSNPASLGKRVSHGCIRTANSAVKKLYSLMDVGDKVYIVE